MGSCCDPANGRKRFKFNDLLEVAVVVVDCKAWQFVLLRLDNDGVFADAPGT